MSQKRQNREEEGGSFDDGPPRKFPSFKSVVQDVMNLRRLQSLMEPVMEPLIRRVVKEEVDSALRRYIVSLKRNCVRDTTPSEPRSLQLKFLNGISLPVFTGTRIEGDGGTNLEVALVDTVTGVPVSSGHISSSKVEIVVLEGDFDVDEGDNWTLDQFRNNIVRAREGKKPLLNGDVTMTLEGGSGSVGDVLFTDNSSWTRSRKFRLGARILDIIGGGIRVREARSEPFIVRDHRGELYKKHHPPSLSDEVWRLEKIGKGGAFHKRLKKEKINSVKEFLMSHYLDPTKLRNILGTGMSAKMWEVTIEHARTCVLDKKTYLYNASEKNGVVFDVVGQVMGIFSDGIYVPADKLSDADKAGARELVLSAFGDRDKVVVIDNESFHDGPTSSSLSVVPSSSNLEPEGSHHQNALTLHKIANSSFLEQSAASPDFVHSVYTVGGLASFDDCLQGIDQPLTYSSQLSDSLICGNTEAMTLPNDPLPYFGTDCSNMELLADIQSAFNVSTPYSGGTIKGKKRWSILSSVLRWCFSTRRIGGKKAHG